MTTPLVTDWGEEWYTDNSTDGATFTVGLYNDSTDAAGETFDVGDVTTEPAGSAYARQSSTVTTAAQSGDYGPETDNQLQFDTSDSTQTVTAAFIIVNFQSSRAGDGSATDHIVAVAALSQSRDLSNIDSVTFNAGDVEIMSD